MWRNLSQECGMGTVNGNRLKRARQLRRIKTSVGIALKANVEVFERAEHSRIQLYRIMDGLPALSSFVLNRDEIGEAEAAIGQLKTRVEDYQSATLTKA
jgi:hypothetical protein